jgi:hypothetical protein
MKDSELPGLRFFAIFFLSLGVAGLLLSSVLSAYYLSVMPTYPAPAEMRMTPRSIHGSIVYQTEQEDRLLDLAEGASAGLFLIGIVSGGIYLEKFGSMMASRADNPREPVNLN